MFISWKIPSRNYLESIMDENWEDPTLETTQITISPAKWKAAKPVAKLPSRGALELRDGEIVTGSLGTQLASEIWRFPES